MGYPTLLFFTKNKMIEYKKDRSPSNLEQFVKIDYLELESEEIPKEADKWKEAIAKDKLTWAHVSNLKFWDEPIAKQYKVESIPATFILDQSGKVVAQDFHLHFEWIGSSWPFLTAIFERLEPDKIKKGVLSTQHSGGWHKESMWYYFEGIHKCEEG